MGSCVVYIQGSEEQPLPCLCLQTARERLPCHPHRVSEQLQHHPTTPPLQLKTIHSPPSQIQIPLHPFTTIPPPCHHPQNTSIEPKHPLPNNPQPTAANPCVSTHTSHLPNLPPSLPFSTPAVSRTASQPAVANPCLWC